MAEYNPPVSACNLPSLALQERESNTKRVISNLATNSSGPPSNKSSKSDQDLEQDPPFPRGSSRNNQVAVTKENGDLQCNGKPHSHISANKANAELKSSNNLSADTASNVKKLNGVITNALVVTDILPNNDTEKEHGGSEALETKSSQNTSQNCDVSSGDEVEQGKHNCILEQSNSKDNDIDVLLNKLENVSVVHTSSTCNNLCENEEEESKKSIDRHGIEYVVYDSERQMPDIMRLITKDLSEPYSIYTYRYFIHNWPKLCFLAKAGEECVGAIVCKLDLHKKMARRGYIAMLAVDSEYRRRQIGSTLVTKAIEAMIQDDCDEVVLETEITNQGALRLYENLGFVRDKRLFRYYLNGVDALRLKLWLR